MVMGLLTIVLGQAMSQAQNSFRSVSGAAESSDSLRKVSRELRAEVMQTSASQLGVGNSCSSLTAAPDGQALWFLSNLDNTGKARFDATGAPFWCKTVLYYIVVPNGHGSLFGFDCAGGAGPGGFDDRCPHKVIIRKEIDFAPSTNFADSASLETLPAAASITPYLTRPNGYKMNFAEPGLLSAQLVGRNFLTFELTSSMPNTITITTRAVSIARARTKLALGSTSLYDSPFTYNFALTVIPSVP